MNIPAWNDDSVFALIVNAAEGPQSEDDVWNAAHRIEPPMRMSDIAASIEHRAIARFRVGDFKPLTRLLRAREKLSAAGRNLIANFLDGKFKRKDGRPPKPIEERETPLTNAAWQFPTIQFWLGKYYPDRRKGEIYDRAIEITARRWGVKKNSLRNLLKHSKNDRRRQPAA
jgi:hypothetical protein